MQSVLITGANRGLGYALASEFHQHGFQLLLVVRREASKAALMSHFPEAKVLVSDVTCENYEQKLTQFIGDTSIDVVINNAGTGSEAPSLFDVELGQLRKEFESHCIGAFSTVRGAVSALQKSDNGIVINISSRRGSLAMQSRGAAKGSGCSYSYRIGKASQNMLTLCLADELEALGIKVAAAHPGALLTDMSPPDAHMTPELSASKLVSLVRSEAINSRDFLCMETGRLEW